MLIVGDHLRWIEAVADHFRTDEVSLVVADGVDVTSWPIQRSACMIARLFQDPRAGICEQMSII